MNTPMNTPANHYVWSASDNCNTWTIRVTSGPTRDEAIIVLRETYDFAGDETPVAIKLWDPDVEDGRDDTDNTTHIVLRRDPNYPGRDGITAEVAELEDGRPNKEWTELWQKQSV